MNEWAISFIVGLQLLYLQNRRHGNIISEGLFDLKDFKEIWSTLMSTDSHGKSKDMIESGQMPSKGRKPRLMKSQEQKRSKEQKRRRGAICVLRIDHSEILHHSRTQVSNELLFMVLTWWRWKIVNPRASPFPSPPCSINAWTGEDVLWIIAEFSQGKQDWTDFFFFNKQILFRLWRYLHKNYNYTLVF